MSNDSRQASAHSVAITRVVDGWSVTMDGDEPTILDEELGTRLGFSEPRSIRKLIRRMIAGGFLNNSDIRATVSQNAGQRGRPGTAYLLAETGTLLVIARSDTKIAHAITRQVIEVFRAVRRGQIGTPQQVAVPVMPNSPTLGDRLYRADVRGRCAMTARCTGASIQRVHGGLRKLYKVSGVYQINHIYHEQVCNRLEAWALGREPLPWPVVRKLSAPVDPAQGVLPFRTALRTVK